MNTTPLPVPLAKAMMNLMPASLLARTVDLVMSKVRSRHPKLFKDLARLSSAVVFLDPTDLAHSFVLELGVQPVTFAVRCGDEKQPDARISGKLEVLIDMLEGRADGDMLFFARDIQITGDTSIIVGLRNTLDREEIDLFTEITSLCGPFAAPARAALGLADRIARRARSRLERVHNELHETRQENPL